MDGMPRGRGGVGGGRFRSFYSRSLNPPKVAPTPKVPAQPKDTYRPYNDARIAELQGRQLRQAEMDEAAKLSKDTQWRGAFGATEAQIADQQMTPKTIRQTVPMGRPGERRTGKLTVAGEPTTVNYTPTQDVEMPIPEDPNSPASKFAGFMGRQIAPKPERPAAAERPGPDPAREERLARGQNLAALHQDMAHLAYQINERRKGAVLPEDQAKIEEEIKPLVSEYNTKKSLRGKIEAETMGDAPMKWSRDANGNPIQSPQ